MIKAIVQVVVDPRALDKVCEDLVKIKEIKKIYEISGEFDVHIELEAETIKDFREILKKHVLKIPGIKTTVSSIVLGEWKSE